MRLSFPVNVRIITAAKKVEGTDEGVLTAGAFQSLSWLHYPHGDIAVFDKELCLRDEPSLFMYLQIAIKL